MTARTHRITALLSQKVWYRLDHKSHIHKIGLVYASNNKFATTKNCHSMLSPVCLGSSDFSFNFFSATCPAAPPAAAPMSPAILQFMLQISCELESHWWSLQIDSLKCQKAIKFWWKRKRIWILQKHRVPKSLSQTVNLSCSVWQPGVNNMAFVLLNVTKLLLHLFFWILPASVSDASACSCKLPIDAKARATIQKSFSSPASFSSFSEPNGIKFIGFIEPSMPPSEPPDHTFAQACCVSFHTLSILKISLSTP